MSLHSTGGEDLGVDDMTRIAPMEIDVEGSARSREISALVREQQRHSSAKDVGGGLGALQKEASMTSNNASSNRRKRNMGRTSSRSSQLFSQMTRDTRDRECRGMERGQHGDLERERVRR